MPFFEKIRALLEMIKFSHTIFALPFAFTSAFAAGGANMAEAQLLATIGLSDKIDRKEVRFPSGNLFLRDIDGLPLWVENWQNPQLGSAF